jgi:membrane fusion protein, multidrug efflux system
LQVQNDLALQNVQRTRALAQTNTVSQAKVDADESQLKAAESQISGLQAQINRKVVRAAFSGRLGIREVNLGQYLSPGTTLTTLEALDSVFVDFQLPQQMLSSVTPGLAVRISIEGTTGTQAEGTVAAVDPSIDEATRTIRVRARVPNAEQKLRPGMFADVALLLPKRENIVALPLTAVVHAPYGDSVFVVEPPKPDKNGKLPGPPGVPVKVARQQFVKLGEARGDFVAVLDGVKSGQEVVTAGAFKLRNNATIVINNNVGQKPQVAPRPENR